MSYMYTTKKTRINPPIKSLKVLNRPGSPLRKLLRGVVQKDGAYRYKLIRRMSKSKSLDGDGRE